MGIHIWQLNMCKNSFSAGVYERWQFSTIVPLEWVTNHQLQWKKTLRQSSNANLIQWWTLGSRTLFSLPYMRTISCFILGNPVQHASLKSIKHATLQQWGTKRKQRVDYLFSLQMLQYKLGVVHYTTSYHIDSSCISISICTDFIYITWAYIYFSLNLAPILITYAGKLDQNLSDAWTPGLLIEIDRSYGTLQLQCVWTFPLASDLLNPLP